MRTSASEIAAGAAALCACTGAVWLAWSMPQAATHPAFLMTEIGAVTAVGLLPSLARRTRRSRSTPSRQGDDRPEALRAQVATLEAEVRTLTQQLRDAANTDDLTGVLKRRAFFSRLDDVIQRDRRLDRPFSFLFLEVDGFGAINAEKGRLAGDHALQKVARALQSVTRGTDSVGRMEGAQFAVALPECEDPAPAVGRLFLTLAGKDGEKREDDPAVAINVGAVIVKDATSEPGIDLLFRVAGAALASARGSGTNRCVTRVLEPSPARDAVSV